MGFLWSDHEVAPIRSGLRRDGPQRIVDLVRSPRSPVILWLGDLDQYLATSALVDLLGRWAARNPRVTVLATMQAVEWGTGVFPRVSARKAERPLGPERRRS